jgi:hypothetical protein
MKFTCTSEMLVFVLRSAYQRYRSELRPLVFLLPLSFAGLLAPSTAYAFDSGRVMGLCIAGFDAAMSAARKTAPAGMAQFTCQCFVDKVEKGESIDQARLACRQQAASRFTVK